MQRREARRSVVRGSDVIDDGAFPDGLESSDSAPPTRLDPSLASALLEALFDVVDASVFVVTHEGRLVVANEQGRALLESHGKALRALLRSAIDAPSAATAREVTVAGLGALRVWRRGFPAAERKPHALVLVEQKAAADATLDGVLENAAQVWGLTSRQKEVFRLVLEGWSNKEIAVRLRTACRTVEVHLTAVFDKAAVDSRARLIATTWKLGRSVRLRT